MINYVLIGSFLCTNWIALLDSDYLEFLEEYSLREENF